MSLPKLSPLHTFTLVSLFLIGVMVAAVGYAHASFFQSTILERESIIVRDLVHALVKRGLPQSDLQIPSTPTSQSHFDEIFAPLLNLSEVVRIKLWNNDGQMVWSDDPALIGARALNDLEFGHAMTGRTMVVFYSPDHPYIAADGIAKGSTLDLVEFYIPFRVKDAPPDLDVSGVLALYRSAESLNRQLTHASILSWGVTALGGMALYGGVFILFRSVYRRQRRAESRFLELSTEHQRIVQIEKLSAVGQMVGEIAHQINNPLVGVTNLVQLAERDADKPDIVRHHLGEIRKAGEHCRNFVQKMLEFTRIAKLERRSCDLRRLVEETADLFRQSGGDHTPLLFQLSDDPAMVEADPTLIRHALFNLLSNAALAAPGMPVEVRLERSNDGWNLAIADEGPGINDAISEKMFTPFFTTRHGGSGLGLPVAEHIALLHGGRITMTNRSAGGAEFAIWLPSNAASAGSRENGDDTKNISR